MINPILFELICKFAVERGLRIHQTVEGGVTKVAVLSMCGRYRYLLFRGWNDSKPIVGLGMLNPSKADGLVDDPTIRKCCGFARRWLYGGILVCNMFGFRETDPKLLQCGPEFVGPYNDAAITFTHEHVSKFVIAWGSNGARFPDRRRELYELLRGSEIVFSFRGPCETGDPKHPLMLAYETDLIRVGW